MYSIRYCEHVAIAIAICSSNEEVRLCQPLRVINHSMNCKIKQAISINSIRGNNLMHVLEITLKFISQARCTLGVALRPVVTEIPTHV